MSEVRMGLDDVRSPSPAWSLAAWPGIWKVAPLAAVGLGAALRLYRLGAWDLVLDEGFTAGISRQAPAAIWARVAQDDPFHPPLYFILLHYWRALVGDGEIALRLFSVVFGLLAIWLIYRMGTYLMGQRIGALAAIILAVSPLHIWHSQEARMYPAVVAFALLGTDAWLRAIRENRARHWVVYVGAMILALYTDYGAFFVVAAQGVATVLLIMGRRRSLLTPWLLSQAALALLYLPWMPILLRILTGIRQVPVGPPVAAHGSPLVEVLRSAGLVPASIFSAFLPTGQPVLKGILIVACGLAMIAGLRVAWRRETAGVALASLVVVPLVLGFALMTRTGVLLARMVMATSPAYYLLLAAGVASARRAIVALVLVALFAANAYSLALIFHRTQKSAAWEEAAAYVSTHIQPDQGIVFVDGRWRWVFGFYYRGPDVGIEMLMSPRDYDRVARFTDTQRVLYLVLREERRNDPDRRVRHHLASRFTVEDRQVFAGVDVARYRLRWPTLP